MARTDGDAGKTSMAAVSVDWDYIAGSGSALAVALEPLQRALACRRILRQRCIDAGRPAGSNGDRGQRRLQGQNVTGRHRAGACRRDSPAGGLE